jgi:hypothetical protein
MTVASGKVLVFVVGSYRDCLQRWLTARSCQLGRISRRGSYCGDLVLVFCTEQLIPTTSPARPLRQWRGVIGEARNIRDLAFGPKTAGPLLSRTSPTVAGTKRRIQNTSEEPRAYVFLVVSMDSRPATAALDGWKAQKNRANAAQI